MVEIKLYNTVTSKKDVFEPIDSQNIRMYVCGPTVYSRPHLGNARSVIIYDLLYKILEHNYPKVTYVRNITDVDDKIIKASKAEGISIKSLTNRIISEFYADIDVLNIKRPTVEPRATENMAEIISMIESLISKDFAYVSQGHVLFRAKKFESYGNLSGKDLSKNLSGMRIEVADYKESPEDFVLWKPEENDEDTLATFKSPWGSGRPGWHIECSAMSCKYLGENFDIHGGGADLKFPHHENEIAQSCCANEGSTFAKYWVHNGFLTVNGEKMSKSLGNFVTVRDLLDKEVKPVVIRYFLLSTHYRKPLDFNDNALFEADKFLKRAHQLIIPNISDLNSKEFVLEKECLEYLTDDMNIALVFAYMHRKLKLAKDDRDSLGHLYALLSFLDLVDLDYITSLYIPDIIKEKITLIQQYRIAKDYEASDKLRDEIMVLGYELQFKPGGKIEAVARGEK